MKCIIPGVYVKVFGRAIHSLSKIGEELYIEPLEHGLALRTVNSSRSAYACFLFAPSFFQMYDDGSDEISTQDSEDDSLRCKIAMKSCLTVFKSLSTIEKTVERCKITLNMAESRLVFQLHCKHGIVKTHNLSFIECETLQAVFSKDLCPNIIASQAKLLCDTVCNFQNNQEEITLIVNPQRVSLKNYVDDEPDPSKVMHTEMNLDPGEFDNFQVGVDTEVTFCLKELRAILAFSEVTNLPLSLHFETAGRPIVFTIDSDSTFEANFVLATLADPQTSNSCTQQPSQSKAPVRTSFSSKQNQNHDRNHNNRAGSHTSHVGANLHPDQREPSRSSHNVSSRGQAPVPGPSTDQAHSGPGQTDRSKNVPRQERSDRLEAAYEELMNDDLNDLDEIDLDVAPGPPVTAGGTRDNRITPVDTEQASRKRQLAVDPTLTNKRPAPDSRHTENEEGEDGEASPPPSISHDHCPSPIIPNQNLRPKSMEVSTMQNISVGDDEYDDEDEDEVVPGTPPSKKFRSLFFGMSQASTVSQVSQRAANTTGIVLAEDTDDEDF